MITRIDSLTSLRFFAAFAVVLYHMRDYSLQGLRGGPLEKAHLAVDLFFILSGFILAHVYGTAFTERKTSIREFFVARLARIYPAHFVMMIIFLLYVTTLGSMGFSYNPERYRPISFIWHISLLDAVGVDNNLTWNFPAWSISAEFFAYLMFPFVIAPVMRLSPRTALLLLSFLLCIFMALNGPFHLTERTVNFSIIRIFPEFLMGILTYRARTFLFTYIHIPNFAFLCTIVLLILAVQYMVPDEVVVVDFVAVIMFGANITGLLKHILAWRPLVYLGEASYSLYLVHAFVLSVFYNALKIPYAAAVVPTVLRDWIVIALTLSASILLYQLVERPGRRFIRTLGTPALRSQRGGARS
jgi:peptidoglycan/LPS O-acetylase OafA/YrhL